MPTEEALRIRDEVGFFQAVRSVLAKRAPADARPKGDLDLAVRQIIARAVAPEGVIDIFEAADLARPVLLAEIAPGRFNLIDGHHRLEKARRRDVETLWAYRLTAAHRSNREPANGRSPN